VVQRDVGMAIIEFGIVKVYFSSPTIELFLSLNSKCYIFKDFVVYNFCKGIFTSKSQKHLMFALKNTTAQIICYHNRQCAVPLIGNYRDIII